MFSRMLDRVDSYVGPAAFLDIADLSVLEGVSTGCCHVSKKNAHRLSLNIPHMTKPQTTIAWIIDRKFCTSATSLSFTTFWEQYDHYDYCVSGAFKKLLSTCPCLTSLDLSENRDRGDWEFNRGMDDGILIDIIEGCPNITNLNISGCQMLSNRAIEAIAHSCPMLESLNLTDCFLERSDFETTAENPETGNDFIYYQGPLLDGITHDCMAELKTGCPSLATIYITCRLDEYSVQLFENELNHKTAGVKTRMVKTQTSTFLGKDAPIPSESESDSDDLSSLL
jgi:hypothetical protein